jgi:CRP/FNR family cyclic AMP-dependent transcriptional regulator
MESKATPPFDPKAFLHKANGGRTISKYRTKQIVFSQGEPADSVFYIHEGKTKVTVISEQGKKAIVAILGLDEFCGEGCLAGQPRRIATATAMTKCEIMRVEKEAMIRVLQRRRTLGLPARTGVSGLHPSATVPHPRHRPSRPETLSCR